MLGEISDTVQIRAHGMRRVVAELHVFQHALTQGGMRQRMVLMSRLLPYSEEIIAAQHHATLLTEGVIVIQRGQE